MKYLGLETQIIHKENGEVYIIPMETYEINVDDIDEVASEDLEPPRTTTATIKSQLQEELINQCKVPIDNDKNKYVDPRIVDALFRSNK